MSSRSEGAWSFADGRPVLVVFAAWVAATAAVRLLSAGLIASSAPRVPLATLLLLSLAAGGIFLVASVAAARPPRRESLRLKRGRLTGQHVFVIGVGAAALGPASDALLDLAGFVEPAEWRPIQTALGSARGGELLVTLLVLGVLSPVGQEFFFRGAMQTALTRRFGAAAGILVASVCFGLFQRRPTQILFGTALGLYAGYLTELSDSVWAGVTAHAVHNSLATGLAPAMSRTSPETDIALLVVAVAVMAGSLVWLRRALPPPRRATP